MRTPSRGASRPEGRDDDWLAGQSKLDWSDPRHDELPRPAGRTTARGGATDDDWETAWPQSNGERSSGGRQEQAAIVRRRQVVALTAVGLVVAAVVIAIAVATSGDGNPSVVPGATLPVTTTPITTTPSSTTPAATAPTETTPTETTPTPTTPTTPTTALTVTLPDSGRLRAGDSGETVVTLQQSLAQLELDVGEADGRFGKATEAAVIAFQTAQGLKPDGIVGPATAEKLNAALGGTSTPQPAAPSGTLRVTLPDSGKLRAGDSGPTVVTLQQALALLSLDVGEADGRFGKATEAAVTAFQTAQGLEPDGVVGPATAEKLNAALASPAARG